MSSLSVPTSRRAVLLALGTALLVTLLHPAAARAVGGAGPPTYTEPVDAPVIDPFRPPSSPYGPGNRGIEYATEAGTVVRAAGAGQVTFSGAVAGGLHVTVRHPDGIRTSYSFLAEILVVRGAAVRRGQGVGIAGSRLHVGARRGETYIDPASLWGPAGPPRVELVPLDGGGGTPGASSAGADGAEPRVRVSWQWW